MYHINLDMSEDDRKRVHELVIYVSDQIIN